MVVMYGIGGVFIGAVTVLLVMALTGRESDPPVYHSPDITDALADVLAMLVEIEREIRTRPYYNGDGVTYPYPDMK